MTEAESFDGGCLCGRLRYRMTTRPIVVNCCHCRDCQRLSGSAFAVNAMIETERVQLGGDWTERDRQGDATGDRAWRCAGCGVLLFSDHRLFGDAMRFVRVGTLDEGERLAPDAHFFTRSRHPWVAIPAGLPAFDTLPENGLGLDLAPDAQGRLERAMAASGGRDGGPA